MTSVKKLIELAEKATGGTWKFRYVEQYDQTLRCIDSGEECIFCTAEGPTKRNLIYIAAACPANLIPILRCSLNMSLALLKLSQVGDDLDTIFVKEVIGGCLKEWDAICK